MKKTIAVIAVAAVALVIAGFVGTVGSAAPLPAQNPPTTIVGVPNSEGNVVTWTITVTGSPSGTTYFVELFAAHPTDSTTSLDPAGGKGKELTIDGNGSVSFTQTAAVGTTFCGDIDVSVDILEAKTVFSDLAGSVTVNSCVPATTTTTSTVPTVTQQSVPPSTTSTTSTTNPTRPPVPPTTPTTLVDPQEELKQLQVAPGVTAGRG